MTLLGDFLKQVLDREEVQKAAASLLIDFFQPKPPPPPLDVIEVKATVKGEKAPEKGDEPS